MMAGQGGTGRDWKGDDGTGRAGFEPFGSSGERVGVFVLNASLVFNALGELWETEWSRGHVGGRAGGGGAAGSPSATSPASM